MREISLALEDEHGHLERHLALDHPVGALRQPHHRHATAAQFANEPVSREHHAFGEQGGGLEIHAREPVDHGTCQHAGMFGGQRGCHQAFDARAQRRVGGGEFA